MLVSLSVQELADFHDHALGVFLEGIFVYNGFYFWMLCVLAVLVQILSPGKWSGMVLVLLVFVAVIALPALHFEHLLYGFRIPYVVHSDMNGFGHYQLQTYTLIAYWGAFCVLLLAAGHLLYPRGYFASFHERLQDARTRLTAPLLRTCAVAALAFVGTGAFIFYNTNVLNDYVEFDDVQAAQARYELDYGRYRDTPAPSIVNPDVQVELYAAERRITSRGTAGLRNNKSCPIEEFVVSVDRRNRVDELIVDGATLVTSDREHGFHLFRPDTPLAPGATLTMRWALARANEGFPNANADNEIVANGSYLRRGHVPVPGYCTECELTVRPRALRAAASPAAARARRSGPSRRSLARHRQPQRLPRRDRHRRRPDGGLCGRAPTHLGGRRPPLFRVRARRSRLAVADGAIGALRDRARQLERRGARGLSRCEARVERADDARDREEGT